MYQYDDPTVAPTLPTPAAPGTPGFFTDGSPGAGEPATILRSDFTNMLMMELLNIVTNAGLTPSKTTYTQVYQAIQKIIGVQKGIATFTSSGSWTSPINGTVSLAGCAAGGGGSSGASSAGHSAIVGGGGGGGGGAGQSIIRTPITVVIGQVIPITIGAKGIGGPAPAANDFSGNPGTAGGSTIIGTVTLVGGGAGGVGNQIVSNALGGGGAGGVGGTGFPVGASGIDGTYTGNGGTGASGPFGGGGGGGRASQGGAGVSGGAASGFGSGGGGGGGIYGTQAEVAGNGSAGAPGFAMIEW